MPQVARLGDQCTGHPNGFPPRPNIEGSDTVFVNGIPIHRQSDKWAVHCNSTPSCHDGVLASGSSTVFSSNLQVGRVSDPVACGSTVAEGSPDVFAGG